MNLRGNTKIKTLLATAFLTLITTASAWAQTVIVNYNFNVADACTAAPTTTAANVTSAFSTPSGTCSTTTTGNAAATSPPAFVANPTGGSAPSLTGILTPSYQFTLGGASLNIYSSYSLFFQLRSSGTGPSTGTLEYSVDGGTTFATPPNGTLSVPTTSTVTNYNLDLTSVVALNNVTSIIFRITGSGGATTGTFRIDNFQVQAIAPTAAGTTAGGRVTEANGRGIFRALVTLTDSQGNQRTAYTNQLGYYQFEDVAGGQVYVFTAMHRRYMFDQPNQVQFIGEETDGINFIGSPFGLFRFDPWNLPPKGIR